MNCIDIVSYCFVYISLCQYDVGLSGCYYYLLRPRLKGKTASHFHYTFFDLFVLFAEGAVIMRFQIANSSPTEKSKKLFMCC